MILEERLDYLNTELLPDKVCVEDALLPDTLINEYLQNGTNLRCPVGTESERGAWCLGQCKINLASKEPISILNPVIDVIEVSSISSQDTTLAESLLEGDKEISSLDDNSSAK